MSKKDWAEEHNRKVRAIVRQKIKAGHPFMTKVMGGVEHIALDFGGGNSSSFIERSLIDGDDTKDGA